jgi:hypothetical protein
MIKKVFIPGLVGALVLLIWTFFLNGILGFNARFNMKPVPNERQVYSLLKTTITEPGRYLCNPALTTDGLFPENEPVFGIDYAGVGHEAAGLGAILGLVQFLLLPLVAVWMLSKTSELFQSRLVNRFSFLVMIGLFAAITGDLSSFGIGASPLPVALLFAARTMVTWTVVGFVIAALTSPAPQASSNRSNDYAHT